MENALFLYVRVRNSRKNTTQIFVIIVGIKMKVSEIRVGALLYSLSASKITFMGINKTGNRHVFTAGKANELIPKLDFLHEELSDGMAVARGVMPRLRDFIENWGRHLLPPRSWIEDIDVLVIVPQGNIHGIPLHLVLCDHEPLGTLVGITYSSSMSLMSRCMSRNPERKVNLNSWLFEEDSSPLTQRKQRTAIIGGVDVLGNKDNLFRDIVTQITDYVKGDVLNFSSKDSNMFSEFSRNSLKAAFRRPDKANILCISAHGHIDLNNHWMSGLLLARDRVGIVSRNIPLHGGRYFDFRDLPLRDFPAGLQPSIDAEVLTSAELEIDGTLDSELVVLLGCSTATGRVFPGDEPASLAETFLHIGACSVLASAWDIDADFVKEWSDHFFNGWLTCRLPKAIAYRRTMRKMASAQWKDRPELLGCMVLKGDWL